MVHLQFAQERVPAAEKGGVSLNIFVVDRLSFDLYAVWKSLVIANQSDWQPVVRRSKYGVESMHHIHCLGPLVFRGHHTSSSTRCRAASRCLLQLIKRSSHEQKDHISRQRAKSNEEVLGRTINYKLEEKRVKTWNLPLRALVSVWARGLT